MDNYGSLKRDLWFGIASTIFSIFFTASTIYTVEARGAGVTGRSFPYLIAIALFILGSCYTVASWHKLKKVNPEQSSIGLSKSSLKRIFIYMAAVCVYLLCITYIGYIVSTAITLLFLMLLSGATNKIVVVIMTILVPVIMWFVFAVLMEVQFPEALLF